MIAKRSRPVSRPRRLDGCRGRGCDRSLIQLISYEWTGRGQGGTNTTLSFRSGYRFQKPQRRWARRHGSWPGALAFGWFATTFIGRTSAVALGEPDSRTPKQSVEVLPIEAQVEGVFCGTAAQVETETRRRSPRVHFVREADAGRRVTIRGLERPGQAGVGASVTLTAAFDESQRELWAKNCEELVRAVGFVISVTFDPPAPDLGETDSAPEGQVEKDGKSLEGSPPPPRSSVSRAKAPTTSPSNPSDIYDVDVAPNFGINPPSRIRGGLGVSTVWGVAPGLMWGAAGFLHADFAADQALGGWVRVQVAGDTSFGQSFDGGVAEFQRLTGALFVGPRWSVGDFHLAPAGVGRGGVFQARGRDTIDARAYRRPWFEAGLALMVGVELFPDWFLELELAGSRAFTRYAFQFEPVVFHDVSPWLAHAGIYTSTSF